MFLLKCPQLSQPAPHFFLRAGWRDHAAEKRTKLRNVTIYNEMQTMMHVPECKVRQSEEPKLRRSYHNTCHRWSDRRELQHLRP